jgi:NAD(P)-dependent dehydrogenase (short-subunit alcohol dehydrogenase family)
MKTFTGRVAAVTGAGSGIGRALARELALRGAHLALSDVDELGLADTVMLCEGAGPGRVTSHRVDVAERDAVYAWAEQVVDDHGRANLIVNNAGVALAASIESMSYEDFEWLMGINFWGVVHGTKAFLPHLKAAGEGHVVNVSSVFGLISVPWQAAYNSAKFAVRGFTDALRMELEMEGSPVSCTTVHPGGVKTNIAMSARIDPAVVAAYGQAEAARSSFEQVARTSPDAAARQILAGVVRGRRRVLVGHDATVIDLISRLPAALTQRAVLAAANRLSAHTPNEGHARQAGATRARGIGH